MEVKAKTVLFEKEKGTGNTVELGEVQAQLDHAGQHHRPRQHFDCNRFRGRDCAATLLSRGGSAVISARLALMVATCVVGVAVPAGSPPPPGAAVDLAALPALKSGVRAYPTPFMAVARTPSVIPPMPAVLDIQHNQGCLAGFSGFVDEATGQIGFPGYGNFTILRVAFDDDKLALLVNFPYPYGRKTRESVSDPNAELLSDDVFEVLIDPRDSSGRSRGPVYRVIGNAAGVCRVDQDFPQVGQFHQSWQPQVRYGTMKWDPMQVWMGGVQVPFVALGGAPAEGDVWGVQCAVRYANPKITAILSPADSFTETARFARLRFDRQRWANYNCNGLSEGEIKNGTFCVGGIVASSSSEPMPMALNVRLNKAGNPIGEGNREFTVEPLATYGGVPALRLPSALATDTERDTVGRITVTDKKFDAVIYDQFVPYWRPAAGERDWLKQRFAKEFTFHAGPYPSKGLFDYAIDCQTLMESIADAHTVTLTIQRDGLGVFARTNGLPKGGKLDGTLSVGEMPDGAKYLLTAAISGRDGQEISHKTQTFERRVMPFETAPRAGLSDVVVPPFTPPVIERNAISVWGRTYRHGESGLLESLAAADHEILARPVRFVAGSTPLLGGEVTLKKAGHGQVAYTQRFAAGGVALNVTGELDYDGFYRFHVNFGPEKEAVALNELQLEIPWRAENAVLIETARDWSGREGDKCLGFLDTRPGRLWDSKTFTYQERDRKGNMPPFVWVGDDERGLVFSCASNQGTHNDDARPEAVLDRAGDEVVLRVWLANKPLTLTGPRRFEFALQASPFKPMPENYRLWRTSPRYDRHVGTYQKNGRYLAQGWGLGNYYPTYGRFLDLAKNKQMLDNSRKRAGWDVICASASSTSECGGTPEYLQFWHEWGSRLGWWDRSKLDAVPGWVRQLGLTDPRVMVESASNTSDSNRDYRAWWLNEVVTHCGVAGLYQDNPPFQYEYAPAVGYGYTRDDGAKEPTCATWNQRTFMKRVATLMVENGVKDSPYVYANLIDASQPGRSFCRNVLYGEYDFSDKLSLVAMRVWLSKQWGYQFSWLCQEPPRGATIKYWRALDSRLFLVDCTDFSRADTADIYLRWWAALDAFWLDDPSVVWHPYYRNSALKSTAQPTTLVSTYTAQGRALSVISNQGQTDTVETVAFQDPGLKHFYDADTGEAIELQDGALRLFVAANDFRVVLGFTAPWKFAAPDSPAQSTLDRRVTVTALARQLLDSPALQRVPNGHRLYEAWLGRFVDAMQADTNQFVYLDQKACASADIGAPAVRKAILFDKRTRALLAVYYNPTDTDRRLPETVRSALTARAGYEGHACILEPVEGYSQWNVLDLPARAGKVELLYPDTSDYNGSRLGPYRLGTMLGNAWRAVAARKAEMEPSP